MDYNILIGGEAGQGMDTLSAILERTLKRNGFEIFSTKDYMSRIRGGHNFIQIRFGDKKLYSHKESLDVIIALNAESVNLHIDRLVENGTIVINTGSDINDHRLLEIPMKEIAGEIGNAKIAGSVALGTVLKLFNIKRDKVNSVFDKVFKKQDIVEINMKAFEKGYGLVGGKYEVNGMNDDDKIMINGNEAVAVGAIAAGCKFYSAYPMTPSTSIMNYMAAKMNKIEMVVEQAEDEIAAINMAIGASYAGARAMTGTSGGGFSLMVEGLGLSSMMELPLVIAEVQRPGPATGLPTRTEQGDLKFVINASQGDFPRMVIALKNPEDAFYQTVRAFNMADKYRIPVILLSDQFLADYVTTYKPFDFSGIENERYMDNNKSFKKGEKTYKPYELTPSGISPRIIPGSIEGFTVLVDSDEHDETGHIVESGRLRVKMNDKRMKKAELLEEDIQEPEFFGSKDFEVLYVAWGSTFGPLKEAVNNLNRRGGKKYGALIFGDIWPLPKKEIVEKAKKACTLVNVEQNATGQLASVIREQTGIICTKSILKYDGRPFSPEYIIERSKTL